MKSMIEKAQKDWGWMQKIIETEKKKIFERVKLDELKSELEQRAKMIEEQVEETIKQLEPTYTKVVEGLKHNAEKVGIDVEKVEDVLRDGVATARERLGIVGDLAKSRKTTKRKSVKKKASKTTAKKSTTKKKAKVTKKKATKKAPSAKPSSTASKPRVAKATSKAKVTTSTAPTSGKVTAPNVNAGAAKKTEV